MASRFWVLDTGTWDAADTTHWSATSGGLGGASVPGSGDTVTFDAQSFLLNGTCTVNTNFSVTSVTCGAMTGTLDFSANNNSPTMQTFSFGGAGTRTINLGSGTFSITGNATTIWNSVSTAGLTFSGASSTVNFTYSGATGTRIVVGSVNAVLGVVNISAGSDAVSLNALTCGSVNLTGYVGALTLITNPTATTGNVTLGTGMTTVSSAVEWDFNGSGTQTLTTNSVGVNFPMTVGTGASTGTVVLADALNIATSTRTLKLTSGTFNAANFNVTCGIFSSSNANTRTLTMGSGTWTITGNNATVWTTSTITGLTLTGTGTLDFTYSGASGTRSISMGTARVNTLKISAGTDIVSIGAGACVDFNTTGFAGELDFATSAMNISGSTVFGAGITSFGGSQAITMSATSSGKTITTNGVTIEKSITLNGVGGVWTLQDALIMGVTRTLGLTNGDLEANNKNVTTGLFSSSNSNTRTLTMGSGTWTLTGTGSIWNTGTSTGLTQNAGTSTIKVTDTSASSKTVHWGANGSTLYNLWLGTGSGTVILGTSTQAGTFNNIRVDSPLTVQVFAGKTITASSLTWSGSAGNRSTFQSTTGGVAWNISVASGTMTEDYISLQDSHASGGATFYAGNHSIDVSGNTGWIFLDPPLTASETAARDPNRVTSLLGADDADPTKTVLVYANATSHAVVANDSADGTDQGGTVAPRDANRIPSILAVSSVDGTTPVVVYMDGVSHELLIKST